MPPAIITKHSLRASITNPVLRQVSIAWRSLLIVHIHIEYALQKDYINRENHMGMFHDAFRDSSRQRPEIWKPAPTISDELMRAMTVFANNNGIDSFEPRHLSFVLVDVSLVSGYFNEFFTADWDCEKHLSHALSWDKTDIADTGLEIDGFPILAIRFWNRNSTLENMCCDEIFFVRAHVRTDEEKRGTCSASHACHEVIWWYEE